MPIRGIFEALGAEVNWDSKAQSITGKKGKTIIKFEIGKKQATINNEKVFMDIAGKMINGRVMVPVRFVAENFGVDVDWDDQKQVVIITTIANWVSDNIYYDIGAAGSGKLGKTDAIGTLEERRSVCQGYAALTTGLLRSIGIPTKLVFGYALGIDSDHDNWEEVDHSRPNHVWNEVLIDNKWIIVDTTWNSKNIYKDGKYVDGKKIYSYFDPTIEAFSDTHKITNR